METSPEDTQPGIYWAEPDAGGATSHTEWLARCRRRLLRAMPALFVSQAVAEEGARSDIDPFARLDAG